MKKIIDQNDQRNVLGTKPKKKKITKKMKKDSPIIGCTISII